jgi:hypothetical protein
VSVTVTTIATDLVLAFAKSLGTPVTDGTEYIDNGTINTHVYDLTEVTAGAASTTVNMTGEEFSAMVAIALRKQTIVVVKTIGTTGTFSTPQLWEDGAPASLTTAEKSAATTFLVAAFVQGESLTFVGSGATGKLIDTDSTGAGTGTYVTYGLITGNVAASDVCTGTTSTATCVITSGTPTDAGVIWEGHCQNQEFTSASDTCTVSGSTTSATAYKHLTTAPGASFRDNANIQTNALRYNASNGAALNTTTIANSVVFGDEANFRISKLQLAPTVSGSRALRMHAGGEIAEFCILEGTNTGSTTTNGTVSVASSGTVRNCVIVLRSTAADHIIGTGTGSPFFYNNTIVAPDDLATAPLFIFLSGASGTVTAQNCGLFAGNSGSAIKSGSATFNFTTSYSDISGTTGVTQTTYSSEFQDVNDATRDYRLVTGAAMKNTGTTDTINAANDIAGTARPSGASYDVGCWEFVAGVVPTAPKLFLVSTPLRW